MSLRFSRGPLVAVLSVACSTLAVAFPPVVQQVRSTPRVGSKLRACPSVGVLADGSDVSTIEVELRDSSGSPVVGAAVLLSTNTAGATVTTQPTATNAEGWTFGEVVSTQAGCVSLRAHVQVGSNWIPLPQQEAVTFVAQPLGPSLVAVNGRQWCVQWRDANGTLGVATPWVMRGVDWSPASRGTDTWPTDPLNATKRRLEFWKWVETDAPLIEELNANTVRLFLDPGIDCRGTETLNQLWLRGIGVVLTVDEGVNDLARVQQAVLHYRDHPAVLAWSLGSEWNLNRYFDTFPTVLAAAQATEAAAALIQGLDPNHPVVSSLGDVVDSCGHLDLASIVNTHCPSVDTWSINVFRGDRFGPLFLQWAETSPKPMFLGEWGTDAFETTEIANPPRGSVNQPMQSAWDLSLWNDIAVQLSGTNPVLVCLGGTVFSLTDEWWKERPPGSQQTDGESWPGSHPDDFANEEYWGLCDIDRTPRLVFHALAQRYDPTSVTPPPVARLTVRSRGANAPGWPNLGSIELAMDANTFYYKAGGGGGGRGITLCALDPASGLAIVPPTTYDTYATRLTGTQMNQLLAVIAALPGGTIVCLGVGDEAGLHDANTPCVFYGSSWVTNFLNTVAALGSTQIGALCFRDSWAMIAVKGAGVSLAESVGNAAEAVADVQVALP